MAPAPSRRTEILEQAARSATQLGLEGISIGKLAGELSMSKSGLFTHFRSKEALQIAVVEYAADLFTDAAIRPALKAPRGEPRLRAMYDNWMTWLTNNPFDTGCFFIAASTEMDDRPGPVRDRVAELQRDYLDVIANITRTGITNGQFRDDLDPEQVAHEVYGVFLMYHHATRLLQDPHALTRAQRSFERVVADARKS